MFKYTRASRPTVYKGTQFRSELEAAWAAFFDIRGIRWEYEPLLSLSVWRPDFSMEVADGSRKLMEVKPYISINQWKNDTQTLQKIINSFEREQDIFVGLLGASPTLPANFTFGAVKDGEGVLEPINMGDIDDIDEHWNAAKNTVRWKP